MGPLAPKQPIQLPTMEVKEEEEQPKPVKHSKKKKHEEPTPANDYDTKMAL